MFILGQATPTYAREDDPNKDFIIGVVIARGGESHESLGSIKHFPGIDAVWGYSAVTNRGIVGVADIAFNGVSTFVRSPFDECNEIELSLYSPNMPWPYGRPVVVQDDDGSWSKNSPEAAIDILIELEEQCPETNRITFNVSPHNFGELGWSGGYNGTGAEWLSEAIGFYISKTGKSFPHIVGVILSENTGADKYPIAQQAVDYLKVKELYDIQEMWVTYLNVKHGNRDDWVNALEISTQFDAVFVATIWKQCYRALYCNGQLTLAGEEFLKFLERMSH